ncbi:DUF1405 domain-containing protein [Candidatus Woesearchaeota archaeon]|nr:DUF1405 domain-containing protein [Candidatus Woesearchaeota archaeon]
MQWTKLFFWLFLLGHTLGIAFGFGYWYKEQLLQTPFYLWIFVPVSPLYALFFLLSLFFIWRSFSFSLFYYMTSVGLLQYGLWGVLFWGVYGLSETVSLPIVLWLAFSHAVMALNIFLLFPAFEFRSLYSFFALVWFGLTAFMQYLLQNNFIFRFPVLNYAAVLIILLTLLSPFLICFLWKRHRYLFAEQKYLKRLFYFFFLKIYKK